MAFSANKYCAQPFAYTPGPASPYDYRYQGSVPGCTNVAAVMNLTNQVNVPFDNVGYRLGRTDCTNTYSDRKVDMQPFPIWPVNQSRLFPTRDFTTDSFPVQPKTQYPVNGYHNFVCNWSPCVIPLRQYCV
uniref:Uncharacterized protein n=1 Tax=viral metagenome TaxID=1070528 RepID=A0A6C0BNP9_9ZZZZ